MKELRNEIIETAMEDVVTTVPDVVEDVVDVVEKTGGLSLGKVTGVVGGVVVIAGLIYGAVKYREKKKSEKTEDNGSYQAEDCDTEKADVETEE